MCRQRETLRTEGLETAASTAGAVREQHQPCRQSGEVQASTSENFATISTTEEMERQAGDRSVEEVRAAALSAFGRWSIIGIAPVARHFAQRRTPRLTLRYRKRFLERMFAFCWSLGPLLRACKPEMKSSTPCWYDSS